MQAQILDVQHRQAGCLEDLHHLADRWRVRARKYAPFGPGIQPPRAIAANRMDQAAAFARQRASYQGPQLRVILGTNMLQHADRKKDVVAADDIAVVVLDEFDPPRESLRAGAVPGVVDLFLGDIEGAHLGAVATGDVKSED